MSKSLKTSQSSTLSSSKKQATQKSLCLELSVDYNDIGHPIFIEAQGCYPLVKSEKKLVKELQEYILEQVVDMFGFQVLPLITDSGIWYEEGEIKTGRVSWNHGRGDFKEVEFEIEL